MNDNALDKVYSATDSDASRKAYNDWANNYDAANLSKGYRIPEIACAMIARYIEPGTLPVLEAGCGTGLIGATLTELGYLNLVGIDLSPEMLKVAEQRLIYKRLYEQDLGDQLPETDDSFSAAVCFGSLGPGHAPASCLDEFVRVTRPGGHIVFNTRADTYPEQALKGKVEALTNADTWINVDQSPPFRTFYLDESELTSQVFVFRVC